MSNWNGGSSNGNNYNNQWRPPGPSYYPPENSQQHRQYVGFNDFLNQYQMSSNNAYSQQFNAFQYTPLEQYNVGNNYNSTNYIGGAMYPPNSNSAAPRNQQNYQGLPTSFTHVPSTIDNSVHNKSGPTKKNTQMLSTNSGNDVIHSQPNTTTDDSYVSTSKLTATAQEFIPQGFKNLTVNEETKQTEFAANDEPSTSTGASLKTNAKVNNKESKNTNNRSYNASNRKSNFTNRNNKYDNTNWRSRDDDVDVEPSTSTDKTITVYNSNSRSNDDNATNSRHKSGGNTKNRETKDYYNSTREKNSKSSNYASNNKYNREGYNRNRNKRDEADVESNHENDGNYSRDRDYARDGRTGDRHHNYRNQHNDSDTENRDNGKQAYGGGNANRSNRTSYSVNESFKQRSGDGKDGYNKDRSGEGSRNYRRKDVDNGRSSDKSPHMKDKANVGQRERLTDQLNRGNLECLVCCDRVRQQDPVWSCGGCFHVLHLNCVKKWANSSLQDGLWRCPACQNQLSEIPSVYRCFCGVQRNPEWHRGGTDTAHACGDICNKTRSCPVHPCTLPCHPGPCLVCEAIIQKKCECGATHQMLKCSNKAPLLCGNVCNKTLECGVHSCNEKCHQGSCPPCKEVVNQKCYCLKETARTVNCESSTVGVTGYSCEEVCKRVRTCGNHDCPEVCHPGPCPQCPLSPELVTHCPCGQTRLQTQRKICLDLIPTCDKDCCLPLGCGKSDNLHTCPVTCHDPPCPPCKLKTPLSCRCGQITKEYPCVEIQEVKDIVRCGRKCTRKLSCARHKCKETCCVDAEHKCPLPCNRNLPCGQHRCEDTCHKWHCQPCWRISFEELRCRCGAAVRYPPVECGARPPICNEPCIVTRPCGHAVNHTCHPAHTPCPPCTVLTQRYCHGKHKLRKTIPCHQEDFSCGLPCGKDMPCGKHKCIESCHKGDCPSVCTQVCNTERPGCGHPCGPKCGHPAPCPSGSPCKALVTAKCPCGRRSENRPCYEQTAAQRKLQMLPGPLGEPVDISELIKQGNTHVTLECDLECQTEDRNRRLAIGLQIRNPDLSSKLAPKYSDYLKQMAVKDENFATRIHEQLRQLVLLSKDSKQRTRSHSFQPMSRPKRQFIHELCQHFGCESVSYDSEPYRNIVATAYKEKSWLPAMSLLEVVRREKGQRRVPPPMLNSSSSSGGSAWATLGSSSSSNINTTPAAASVPEPPRKPRIDYFDMPPED